MNEALNEALMDSVQELARVSGNRDLALLFFGRLMELFELWALRQRKYGPENIAGFGELGCLVRSSDKMARLKHSLLDKVGEDSVDETVEDAWNDMANYAIMAVMCRRGQWPNATPTPRAVTDDDDIGCMGTRLPWK